MSKCHDFKMKSVFFPHPKYLYLHSGNADVNCLTNPGGKKYQLIVVEKTVESLIMVGTELVSRASVAIVTCEG